MKNTLKVFSWIQIVLGGLAILGGLDPVDGYAIVGGMLFITCGWVALIYIAENN